jgi:pectin methylesterase-like acyl-CoA thioesterase
LVLILLLALALLTGGGYMIYRGLNAPPEYADAPLPTPFTVASDEPVPSAPSTQQMDEDKAICGYAPNTMCIPSLKIEAPLIKNGVANEQLTIPSDPKKISIYDQGAMPGDTTGTILMAGHINMSGVQGALYNLSQIKPNAVLYLTNADGATSTWRLTSIDINLKAELPQDVFDRDGQLRAVIVTCGGPVSNHHYRDNVRAYFEPFV